MCLTQLQIFFAVYFVLKASRIIDIEEFTNCIGAEQSKYMMSHLDQDFILHLLFIVGYES
jgi:membrane protein insertase Oxa1/YidC/SpoIIIJ